MNKNIFMDYVDKEIFEKKELNDIFEYIINDNELLSCFIKNSDSFRSFISEISYDLFKKIIIKIQENNLVVDNNFLSLINEEYQYRILQEDDINDDTLVLLLSSFRNKVKTAFFKKDARAIYLYRKFDINDLAKKGVKFSDDIISKKEFFEMLKNESFILFRANINNIEKNNNPLIIENRLEDYYDEIINSYDNNSDLFHQYNYILCNPKKYNFDNSYILDSDSILIFNDSLVQDSSGYFYYNDKNEMLKLLKDKTSKKLSEVVVDALFRDNIYNVWLNIREMLRYNDMLILKEKGLTEEEVIFYKTILDIDKMSNLSKIDLYNKFKNKNYNFKFYEDLKKIKNIAYDKIKNDLINPYLYPEYLDSENTEKYGVKVYDLRDKEFVMLVRTQLKYKEDERYRRSCYSIISNENTQVFGEYDNCSFLYGYNTFENDMVLHMFESDSYSLNFRDDSSKFVNRIMNSEQLIKCSSGYSEVQLINYKSEKDKYKWTAKKPDYIIVFEHIRDIHIDESKRLNIPIVIIKKRILENEKIINIGLNKEDDIYVNDLYIEKERRIKR